MEKSPDAFRTISEAADELDLPQHVLRFWETRFATIKPLKRGGGRRYYRPEDVLLLKGIRHLLYDQGFTIKGVQKILKDQGARHVAAIGSGGPVEALPPPTPDLPEDDVAQPAIAAPAPPVRDENFTPPSGIALSGAARDRLAAVLRDLLECKRMLERAREN
ncbi:MAG: MerR family transcriptional regulator [Devosia sp.]|uniref:MerR family transcriptional regulator n=1 Tax=Devosia sp. TaxID=1871048 RepID=UPI001A50D440|nr:MerR family transcriptional regulator [Devosia sp.]MBL8599132.1 MerR family transcriptional regulator [Devosia sp.]